MIQRIQTVYLLLAVISLVLMIFVPMGTIYDAASQASAEVCIGQMMPLLAGAIASAVLAFAGIFLFKNLKLQMNVIRINMFVEVLLIAGLCYFLLADPNTKISRPGIGLPLPLFAIIFNFLALKGIRHDQNLLRSYDRLR